MGKLCAIFVLLAGSALAQNSGGNYSGAIRGKLFRDLSSNPQGLFEKRPNQAFRVQLTPNQVTVPGTTANCVVGLVEVPLGRGDQGMMVRPQGSGAVDHGIVIAPTLPACPPRK